MEGFGIMRHWEKHLFMGDFVAGEEHADGTLIGSDGSAWKGKWKRGKKSGGIIGLFMSAAKPSEWTI